MGRSIFEDHLASIIFFQKQVLRYNEYLVDMQVLKISAINVLVPTHIFILKIAP